MTYMITAEKIDASEASKANALRALLIADERYNDGKFHIAGIYFNAAAEYFAKAGMPERAVWARKLREESQIKANFARGNHPAA